MLFSCVEWLNHPWIAYSYIIHYISSSITVTCFFISFFLQKMILCIISVHFFWNSVSSGRITYRFLVHIFVSCKQMLQLCVSYATLLEFWFMIHLFMRMPTDDLCVSCLFIACFISVFFINKFCIMFYCWLVTCINYVCCMVLCTTIFSITHYLYHLY